MAHEQIGHTGLQAVEYTHPDALRLTAEVQEEYVRRYGSPDDAPIGRDQFAAPLGRFVLMYDDGEPVAMGGWRMMAAEGASRLVGGPAAELKRMYVVPHRRGRGHARAVLADLELSAAAAGAEWLVLETGLMQPEAITLYQHSGYLPIPAFGHYATSVNSVHLGKRIRP